MTRNPVFGLSALCCLLALAACSESAPELIELTYRDRCPASETPVSLISMDELARIAGAKLLNPESGPAPVLIRVNAPSSLANGQGIRLATADREGSTAIATFVANEARDATGNACSILTIAPDAAGYSAVSAMFDGKQIGSVLLAATAPQ